MFVSRNFLERVRIKINNRSNVKIRRVATCIFSFVFYLFISSFSWNLAASSSLRHTSCLNLKIPCPDGFSDVCCALGKIEEDVSKTSPSKISDDDDCCGCCCG